MNKLSSELFVSSSLEKSSEELSVSKCADEVLGEQRVPFKSGNLFSQNEANKSFIIRDMQHLEAWL